VRLLDVAAGYGFLVRDGAVRRAHGVYELTRPDGSQYRPEPIRDTQLFTREVSRQVLDMLADPAARRRRFGRGLPLDQPEQAPVALKTGTASGMSDVSAVLVSSELTVAAWSGRFDGAPTHGMSGMWGALPLAQRALATALHGTPPDLPVTRVAGVPGTPLSAANDLLPRLEPWAERARVRAVAR
jgi:membrane carboxypeptidase/penicillin-binding protein PbpC